MPHLGHVLGQVEAFFDIVIVAMEVVVLPAFTDSLVEWYRPVYGYASTTVNSDVHQQLTLLFIDGDLGLRPTKELNHIARPLLPFALKYSQI